MKLTKEMFDSVALGEVIASGTTVDCLEGLHMAGTGEILKWVALKGYADDWVIYTHFAYKNWTFIKEQGDKVQDERSILNVIDCDKDVLKLYRH